METRPALLVTLRILVPNKGHTDSKVHRANMGLIWGRQDPGGPHVGPMNFAIWAVMRSFGILGVDSLNKLLSEHSIFRLFEAAWRSYYVIVMYVLSHDK